MILSLLLISLAHADPKVVTINEGEIAPFTGTLFNSDATAAVLASSNAEEKRCKIKMDLEIKSAVSTIEKDKEIVESNLVSCENSLSVLEKENIDLTKKYNRSLTMRPYIATTGFIGGVGLTILIVSALGGTQ